MPNGKERDKEEEVMSEVTERAMEANMKILVGNEISHSNRVSVLAETAVAQAIQFQQKANDEYLERTKQMADAYMEQANSQNKEAVGFVQEIHKQYLENNRYTLDRLYSVFPEEAVGIGTLLKAFESYLKEKGWTPPAKD